MSVEWPVPALSIARKPFDNLSNADLILCSSDNVGFYVVKYILISASPVFSKAFFLPISQSLGGGAAAVGVLGQPGPQHPPQYAAGFRPVPIIYMAEHSSVLDSLLRLTYPLITPRFQSLNDVEDVLLAIVKFKMTAAVMECAKQLVESMYLQKYPVSVYSIACRYGWKDLAQKAAREILRFKNTDLKYGYTPELETISTAAYRRLYEYHRACRMAACNILGSIKEKWFQCDASTCQDPVCQVVWEYMAECCRELATTPHPGPLVKVYQRWCNRLQQPLLSNSCWSMHAQVHALTNVYVQEVQLATSRVELEFFS